MIYTGFASRQTDDVDEQTTQYKARTNEATSHVELTNRLTRRLFGSHIVARGCNFLTMAGFNGKWRLVGGENVEAYQTAIKTPEDAKAKLKAIVAEIKADPNAYVEEIFVDQGAGVVRRTLWLKGEKKRENEVQFGKEQEAKTLDGRAIKVKATLESDNKLTVVEKGADFESVVTFELSGNEINVTQVSGGVKATEKFVRA